MGFERKSWHSVPGVLLLTAIAAVIPAQGAMFKSDMRPAERGSRESMHPRRTHPGDGDKTIYDAGRHAYWLADANLAAKENFGVSGINRSGSMSYQTALAWVEAMNGYDNGKGWLGHHNWMLPMTPTDDPDCQSHNKKGGGSFGFNCRNSDLGSLYYGTFGLREPDTAVPVRHSKAGPFENLQPYLYWTATKAKNEKQGFITFSFVTGWAGANIPRHNMYVLPMFPGSQPTGGDKLTPSADGKTVYDPNSQVTWLVDANLAAREHFGLEGIAEDGSMSQETAVAFIDAMKKAKYLGHGDWALPEGGTCGGYHCAKGQLGALFYNGMDLSPGDAAVSAPHVDIYGFHNLQPYLYWSCQAHDLNRKCEKVPTEGMAWSFSFGNGFEGTDKFDNALFVTVYYPEQTNEPPGPKPPHRTQCQTPAMCCTMHGGVWSGGRCM